MLSVSTGKTKVSQDISRGKWNERGRTQTDRRCSKSKCQVNIVRPSILPYRCRLYLETPQKSNTIISSAFCIICSNCSDAAAAKITQLLSTEWLAQGAQKQHFPILKFILLFSENFWELCAALCHYAVMYVMIPYTFKYEIVSEQKLSWFSF